MAAHAGSSMAAPAGAPVPGGSAALSPPRPPRKLRSLALQTAALLVVVAAGAWLVHNAAANLAARHIASGFGFLRDTAGFAISEGLVPYTAGDSYARAF